MHGLLMSELQQHGGGQGRGDRAVGGVVPASGADAGGVAKTALGLVGNGGRGDPGFAVGAGSSPAAMTAAQLSLGWAGSSER